MDCAYFRTHQIKTQRFFSVVCECNSRPVAERSRSHTFYKVTRAFYHMSHIRFSLEYCAYIRSHKIKNQRFFSVVCEWNNRPVAERSRSHTIICENP